MTDTELVTVEGAWNFQYRYFAGETASRFFAELRDHGRIVGRRCPRCQRVLVPARSYCDRCFVATTDWVPVGMEGTVETFTVLTATFPGLPEPPLAIAYVTLDGVIQSPQDWPSLGSFSDEGNQVQTELLERCDARQWNRPTRADSDLHLGNLQTEDRGEPRRGDSCCERRYVQKNHRGCKRRNSSVERNAQYHGGSVACIRF